ncbi:hypothetical protein LSH36_743g01005 [Paralvinella palmiformis]|uniref:LIM zinc-binding domain-containing protein n=1 Tax=Paralvinella palmiformis TaxID=53620 RepID=A0AAD9J0X2_9ANNE|nr:hypothetical protein LSH36_743g01005 [Paralvinella palmiformis]
MMMTFAVASCYRKLFVGEKSVGTKKQEYVDCDDPECCPRCGKRVYFAEQLLSLGRKWHKMCFTCASCKKRVDSNSAADHDGELFCRGCHTRNFGPKGYGFAGGAGTGLSMDTGRRHEISRDNVPHTAEAYIAPVTEQVGDLALNSQDRTDGYQRGSAQMWKGGDICPRCEKQVFIAEKRQAAGNCYHEKCFTCLICNKKLDSTKLTEKDGEILCKVCYGKKFGPKGYGFGVGAGTLQMT